MSFMALFSSSGDPLPRYLGYKEAVIFIAVIIAVRERMVVPCRCHGTVKVSNRCQVVFGEPAREMKTRSGAPPRGAFFKHPGLELGTS